MTFFILFIIATILLGSVYIGPASARVWMTILMLMVLLGRSTTKGSDVFKDINTLAPKAYALFLLFMFISLVFNGELFEYGFFRRFLAYYLVCFVSYYAVGYYIKDYKSARSLVYTLVLIATLNNILAILQFSGNSLGWSIGGFFGDVSSGEDFTDSHSEIVGFSVIPGIFGDPVMSGFVTAIIAPLLFINNKGKNKALFLMLQILIIALNVYGCFATQQRNAFLLLIVTGVIVTLKYIKDHPFLSVFVILLLLAFLGYIVTGLEAFEWGRLFTLENDTRSKLWAQAIAFISDHPLFGGPMAFQRQAGLSSHNLLLDSYIFSGLGGFVVISFLWIWSLYLALKYMIKGIVSKVSNLTFLLSIATFNTMIYGLFHNTSFLSGYNIIFVVLALLLCSIKLDKSAAIQ